MSPRTRYHGAKCHQGRDTAGTRSTGTPGQDQGQNDPKMVHDTPPSPDASTHQIWDSYINLYRRFALDMIILETRSGINVNKVTDPKMAKTHYYPKIHPSKEQMWDSYVK